MNDVYVEVAFSHESFTTGKIAIIKIPNKFKNLVQYETLAKEKISETFGFNVNEFSFFNFRFLGDDVIFI